MSKLPFTQSNYILNTVHLHQLSDDDANTISQTLVQMQPWHTLGYSVDALSNYLRRPDPSLYRHSLIVSQQLVGVVGVRYPWLRGACLELLAIFPSQQGKGAGRDVIHWLETELCQKTNSRNIWTLVSSFNHEAQHFYQKMGFVQVAQLDDLIVTSHAEMLLRKMLIVN